jgi:hypothetical protein
MRRSLVINLAISRVRVFALRHPRYQCVAEFKLSSSTRRINIYQQKSTIPVTSAHYRLQFYDDDQRKKEKKYLSGTFCARVHTPPPIHLHEDARCNRVTKARDGIMDSSVEK